MVRKKNPNYGKKEICVDEGFKISVSKCLDGFRHQNVKNEIEFPSSFKSTERAYIHQLASQLGLTSKSKGKGASRYLTVLKKKQIEGKDVATIFKFGPNSCRVLHLLLTRFPVKQKEKLDLLPKAEKIKCGILLENSGSKSDSNKTSGRLNNGIPQVPSARKPSELDSFRRTLPVTQMKGEIVQLINNNNVSLICGQTGSGKTTQIPQFILDESNRTGKPCRILCAQPRRISAVSMAERVAAERNEYVGNTVGYQIRLESRVCPRTLLTFCTNGVLLRTLMTGDNSLNTVTHIIVDEVHERDRFSDFLLIKLRQLIRSRQKSSSPRHQKFTLILMSAALDFQLFANYFDNCSVINIPGRMFDVKEHYLEDVLKLSGHVDSKIHKEGNKQEILEEVAVEHWKREVSSSSNQKENSPRGDESWSDLSASSFNDSGVVGACSNWENDTMNQALKCAWTQTGDQHSAFAQMMHMIQSEGISVDHRHPELHITPLMTAAQSGLFEECEQLVGMGAHVELFDDNKQTAANIAASNGHDELAMILATFIEDNEIPVPSTDESCDETAESDKQLVSMYHKSFNDDKVDCNLILKLLHILHQKPTDGAILVFLPGYDDIVTLRELILSDEGLASVKLFTLHSSMQSSADQKLVFRTPPSGFRKIILSTNIAESSVTINDVVYVVDSGKEKLKTYDAISSMTALKSVWISQSSAEQRKGRAGRCRPGECYHMFSRSRYDAMHRFQVPEILRTPLHELCLQAKLLSSGKRRRSRESDSDRSTMTISDFLAQAPEAPSRLMIDNAVNLMKTIDALDPFEELTELGQHLVDLPIEPKLGKMILYSVVLKCLDPVLTIACVLAYKDPFMIPISPTEKHEAARCKAKFGAGTFSDHMSLLRAFQAWQKSRSDGWEKTFCSKNYLSPATMEMIIGMRTQLLGQLRAAGFVRARGGSDIRDLNTNSENWAVVKGALCASAFPHVLRYDDELLHLSSAEHSKVRFHKSSTLARDGNGKIMTHSDSLSKLRSSWMIYDEMVQTAGGHHSLATARCCTSITPACLAMFAGPSYHNECKAVKGPDMSGPIEGLAIDSDSESEDKSTGMLSTLMLTDWVHLKMDMQLATMLLQLRVKWHTLFLRRIRAPAKPWLPEDETVLSSIINILSSEDQAHGLLQPSGIGQRPRPIAQEDCSRRSNMTHSSNKKSDYHQSSNERSPSYNKYYQENNGNRNNNRNNTPESIPTRSMEKKKPPPLTLPPAFTPPAFTPPAFTPPAFTPPAFTPPSVKVHCDVVYLCFVATSAKNIVTSQLRGYWLLTTNDIPIISKAVKRAKVVNVVVMFNDVVQGFARLTSEVGEMTDSLIWQSYTWDTHDKCVGFVTMEWSPVTHQQEALPILKEMRLNNSQVSIFELGESFGHQLSNYLHMEWSLMQQQQQAEQNKSEYQMRVNQSGAGGDSNMNFKLNPYSPPYTAPYSQHNMVDRQSQN